MPQVKRIWADPNREGKSQGRQGKRYCARCGNTVQHARILKNLNLCEFCVKELVKKRDGIYSCRGCGRVLPRKELQKHKGYCSRCVCPACDAADPVSVKKTGLCLRCNQAIGDFCRVCGKEAASQVRKNQGLCDSCLKNRNAFGRSR